MDNEQQQQQETVSTDVAPKKTRKQLTPEERKQRDHELAKKFRQQHPGYHAPYHKDFIEQNPDYYKDYYAKNRERIRAYQNAYYKAQRLAKKFAQLSLNQQ